MAAKMRLAEATSTKGATAALNPIRRQFMRRWLLALDDFYAVAEIINDGLDPVTGAALDARAVTAARAKAASNLVKNWHEAIEEGHTAAYREGRSLWGTAGRPLAPMSSAAEAAMRLQKQFAFRFAMDVARGIPDEPTRMSAHTRSDLHGNVLAGSYHRGTLDASPPGQLIYWRLGIARHCVDCPVLAANSPYTKETLPTVPRAGACRCKARCMCFLEYATAEGVTTSRDNPVTPEEKERARDLRDRIEGPRPTPPPGKRLPDAQEERVLLDLEQRANFASRRAARAAEAGDVAEQRRWNRIRSELTGQSIEFQSDRKIWSVPTFSDKEVLNSADLRAGDVSWLTHLRGIDGSTVHRAQAAAIEQSVEVAKADLDELMKSLPAGTGAVVPDFDELVKLAGGPRFKPNGEFDDALLFEEPARPEIPDPREQIVLNLVGLGAVQTLRSVLAAFEACRSSPFRVNFGPIDDGWMAVVQRTGLWIEGDAEDAWDLAVEVARRIGGRGVEVTSWQL